jgi:hypothetical protein
MAWWRLGIGKLRGSSEGRVKGKCHLCLGEEDSKHILLECPVGEKKCFENNG